MYLDMFLPLADCKEELQNVLLVLALRSEALI